MKKFAPLVVLFACLLAACNTSQNATPNQNADSQPQDSLATETKGTRMAPPFNADTAYRFTQAQVDFGPRIPNSPSHTLAARLIENTLKRYKAKIYSQNTTLTAWDGKKINITNIIAAYNPSATHRIAIFSHWDSRPWADQDSIRPTEPIDAANDGASGVAVMLEVARNLALTQPNIGVDLIFLDAEDYGKSEKGEDSYCLGTQYWGKNPHVPGYKADMGILLDMVGAPGATFTLEGTSKQYAAQVQQRVWGIAGSAGFGRYFNYVETPEIIDDHYFINRLAHIPTVDVIHINLATSNFAPYWHTHNDNMQAISKPTLEAVGQTMLEVIWREAAGKPAATAN